MAGDGQKYSDSFLFSDHSVTAEKKTSNLATELLT